MTASAHQQQQQQEQQPMPLTPQEGGVKEEHNDVTTTTLATSATAAVDQQQPQRTMKLPDLKKSTIYRRHEARLAKSYELREDSRPAILRVMAGLPGFRMIVPPYQPTTTTATTMENNATPKLGVYSESTLFTSKDEMVSPDNNNNQHAAVAATQSLQQQQQPIVLQAMFATAVSASLGEYLFGRTTGGPTMSTPFGTSSSAHRGNFYSPFAVTASDSSSLAMQLQKRKYIPKPKSTTTVGLGRQIAFMGSSTSILFGTKVYTQETLEYSPVVASAVAGTIAGLFRQAVVSMTSAPSPTTTSISTFLPSHVSSISSSPPFSSAALAISRQIVAATLYFSTYEYFTTLPNTDDDNNNSKTAKTRTNLTIATAGALAGTVHSSLTILMGKNTSGMLLLSPSMVPAILRAAPIHAVIFLGYESMKQHTPQQPQ